MPKSDQDLHVELQALHERRRDHPGEVYVEGMIAALNWARGGGLTPPHYAASERAGEWVKARGGGPPVQIQLQRLRRVATRVAGDARLVANWIERGVLPVSTHRTSHERSPSG